MLGKFTSRAMGQAKENLEEDVVIAVMGSTGSGKSSFIKLLTGDDRIIIGNSIESETSDVQPHFLLDRNSGQRVVIVDTPGFDDSRSGITDTEILRRIANFLVEGYDKQRKLNGLIYMQRISDPRFGGQARRNLRMFRSLCGTEAFSNVVVVTTFWDNVTEEVGSKREEQLCSTAFKDLVEGGARFVRHDQTFESAIEVIGCIFTFTPKDPRIVEEIRKEGKSLEDTEAGSVRREEMDRIIAQQQKEIAELKAEIAAIHGAKEAIRKELQEEKEKLRQKLARWKYEQAELKKGLGQSGQFEENDGPKRTWQEVWVLPKGNFYKLGMESRIPNFIRVPFLRATAGALDFFAKVTQD